MAKQRYEFVAGSSSKFWEVSVSGSTLTVTFGRIGTDGRTTTKDLGSPAVAKKEAEKLIAQKTTKGYQLVSGGTTKAALKKKASPKEEGGRAQEEGGLAQGGQGLASHAHPRRHADDQDGRGTATRATRWRGRQRDDGSGTGGDWR